MAPRERDLDEEVPPFEISRDDYDSEDAEDSNDEKFMIESAFANTPVPSWKEQLTFRAIMTAFLLSIVFNFIVCKLNLTTGVIPSLNVAAGLLGYAIVKAYTTVLNNCGLLKQPFTRQENTVIQTCVVASSGIAFSSGTATYLLGMSPAIAAQSDSDATTVILPDNVKKLHVGWIMGYLFIVSFIGLFSIVPLRKMMVLKYKLTYPSGTATAFLINSFHTPKGAKLAAKQVSLLFKACGGSIIWAFFQWFFAASDGCGFDNFPTFGLQAFNQRFYFDFSATYVGVGMICPYMINISLLIGGVISWGIMWPLIENHKGKWYSAELPGSSLHGIQGYRVFLAIAMMLGDGLYHVVAMLIITGSSFWKKTMNESPESNSSPNYDKERRTMYFLKDRIPTSAAVTGYLILAIISIIVVPLIFHQIKWYHLLVAYIIAPLLAFCNAYGCGLTDWSLASNYGKLAIIIFSAWVGNANGGIVAGLASCGVMMSIVSAAADLMQDFKTGYLTLSSPRAMFFSQVIGTAMGCFITPLVFWIFYKAYPLGDPTGTYPAPYASIYRGIAVLGAEGVGSLPKNCLTFAIICFFLAIVINSIRDFLKHYNYGVYKYIPSPMCLAIPFYIGSYFTIDMCIGSLILFIWEKKNKQQAKDFGTAVASGLICGDSLWGIPESILSLAGVGAPICMKFLSASDNARVDNFLTS